MRPSIVMLVLTVFAMPCPAADGELSGWLRLDAYSSTRRLDDRRGDASTEFGLKYALDVNENQRLKFEGGLIREWRDNRDRSRLVDAWWQHRGTSVDWRVGQQRISWGKADGLNPTDFFTPHDYTLLQPFEDDQRRSVPAVRADITAGEGKILSVVAVPYFSAERQPMPHDLHVEERSPNGFHRPQVGVRFSSTGETLDWSVSAFRGYLNSPLLSANGGGLFHHYAELNAVGADMARNFGRWGFRAEIAWLHPEAAPDTQGIQPQAYMVAGVDHGEDDWNVNLQAVLRYTPGFEEPTAGDPLRTAAAQQNAINFGQLRRHQIGFTSRLSGTWMNQTLQGEVLLVHYLNPGNTLIRPLLTYAISDANRFTVGAEFYRGPDASFFGQLKRNRTVFLEYRHFF